MNRSPALLALVALTTTATLTVSACGSGDGDSAAKGTDKVVDTGSEKLASSSPSPSTLADRPKTELPSDVTYEFQWKKTGDPAKDAVLNDAEQRIKAVDMAIAEQDPLHEAYHLYSEGTAAAGSQNYIQDSSITRHARRV